ncbi:MAG: tetratricopeptide repeat protein [Treponema sp.]|nr:tetratricopeptide repeat protein [Treponema sp.]
MYSSSGNYTAAEEAFKKALAYMDPAKKDPVTYYNLSTVMYAQGKKDNALAYAKQAYDNKANAVQLVQTNITYNYALMCEETGGKTNALSLYKEVLAADPKNVKALTNIGALSLESGDADSALTFLQKAYSLESGNFEVNNNLGNAYRQKADYDNAVKYYQGALKISPKDNTVRENLAKAYASAGNYDKAKSTYQDVIAADKKNWDAYFELAKVCITLKDTNAAKDYLSFLQRNNPDYKSSEVKQLLSSL